MADLSEFSGQISLKIDRLWDNLTRIFTLDNHLPFQQLYHREMSQWQSFLYYG